MLKNLTLLFLTVLLVACGSEKEKVENTEKEKEIEKPKPSGMQIEDLKYMEGNWIDALGTMPGFNEKWVFNNDSLIQVIGYFANGKDTAIFEVIKIRLVDNVLHYIAKVDGENEGKEVLFALQPGSTLDSFTFANSKHDYPQEITYVKKKSDSVMVHLKGLDEEKNPKFYDLILKKSGN